MAQRTEAAGSVALKDGRHVTIRNLLEGDRAVLTTFGQNLPKNDILYLEDDFTHPEIITRLANAAHAENWRQIIAVTDEGQIVGYTAALRMPGWSNHVANIRLIVATKVTVDMLAALTAGQAIFSRLGFAVEGQLARHAIDRDGNLHDIVIMSAFVRV
jgi:hypothetical protein